MAVDGASSLADRSWLDRLSGSSRAIWLTMAAVLVAELFVSLGRVRPGLVVHGGVLCVLTLMAWRSSDERLYQLLALLPAYRLVTYAVPSFGLGDALWLATTSAVFLTGVVVLVALADASGERRWWTVDWYAVTAGAGAGVVIAIAAMFFGGATNPASTALVVPPGAWQSAFVVAGAVSFAAAVEEAFFRGVLQRTLVERLGRAAGVGTASVAFGVLVGSTMPGSVSLYLGAGLLLGAFYEITDDLFATWTAHTIAVTIAFAVAPALA